MHLNGKDLRDRPLMERARRLAKLLARSTVPVLHLVPSFPDGAALLRSCEELKLEGIVSKRADRPYRSGPARDWLKCKMLRLEGCQSGARADVSIKRPFRLTSLKCSGSGTL